MYRRRSEEGSVTPTQENRDVFDDEFAVDDFDLVADGFRPESAREGDERHSQDPPIHTTSAHYATDPDLITPTAPAPNRNSISKTRSDENPFASPEDGPRMDFERSPSIHSQSTASFAPGIARRSTSSASSNLFASTSSPRFGADGPSHPYAMYPQGTIPRSPSIATTSTVQPNRNSSVRHAPQHPYAMYPQGVTEDDHLEDDDDAQTAAPAVGFPGLGQPYQRVRGPDGEEQDIIGMDGHAEQLPPYTRYPEEGPKMPILAVPGELHSRGPVAGTDPGMPLMHQHIPPPAPTPQQQRPQSMTDQSQLERHSIQDRGIDSHASLPLMERVASESTGYTEKSWKEKTWKEKRKTRFCGVQFLWLVMGICALGFIGAIVGGIMGGYATGTESGRKQAESSSSSSSSVSAAEARRIATPTVSPPTGTFKLSLTTPTNERSGCVADPSRKPAWDCDLSGPPAVAISVGVPAAPRPTDGAFFFFASSDETYEYGAQYRYMNTEFAPFVPLQETDDDDKGPAFYFSQKYDKIVILEETAFDTMPTTTIPSTPTPRRKRAEYATSNGKPKQKIVQSGDQPWLCIWNDTLIEGWIYVERAVTSNFPITPTSTPFSTPTANSTPGDASLSSYTSTPTALVSGPPMPGIDTTSTLLSGSNYITTTVTKTSINPTASTGFLDNARRPPGSFSDKHFDGSDPSAGPKRRRRDNDWPHRRDDDHVDENEADADDDDDDDEDDIVEEVEAPDTYMTLEQYPYLIKIEERRVPDADNPPYCQQFQLLNDGNLSALTNDDGSDILFAFEENPPEYSAYDREVSVDERSILQRAATPTDGCHCQWWSE